MREPLPVWYLGIFLISFTSLMLAAYKIMSGHGWNPGGITTGFLYDFSQVAFVFIAIILELFTFKIASHFGYIGIVVSFIIWLGVAWALVYYVIG